MFFILQPGEEERNCRGWQVGAFSYARERERRAEFHLTHRVRNSYPQVGHLEQSLAEFGIRIIESFPKEVWNWCVAPFDRRPFPNNSPNISSYRENLPRLTVLRPATLFHI